MKSIAINLKLAENVKQFVNVVNKYDYDMDLRSGRTSSTQNRFWAYSALTSACRSCWKSSPTAAKIFCRILLRLSPEAKKFAE